MHTSLDDAADARRLAAEALNQSKYGYGINDEYGVKHTNALSDGDDRGRGEDADIGTKTDIDGNPTVPGSGRNPLIAFNQAKYGFSKVQPYTAPTITGIVFITP